MSAEGVVDDVVSTVGLWWPSADEDELRAAADAWDRMAVALDDAHRATVPGAAGWQGDASAAFVAAQGRVGGALVAQADGSRRLAAGLRAYAEAVVDAKRRVEELAITVGATIVAGTALAVVTFGAAEVAAAGVSAGLVAAASAVGVELSTTVAAITGGVLTGAVFGAAEATVVDAAVAQPLRVEGFGDGGYSLSEVGDSAVGGGALGGPLGGVGAMSAARPILRTAAGDLEAVRAPGGRIRAALDPPNWGVQGRRFEPGVHETAQRVFTPQEQATAQLMAGEGKSVYARSETYVDGVKNPDALVRRSSADPGTYVELKAPTASSSKAVKKAITDAERQLRAYGGGEVVVDGRTVGLTRDVAELGLARALGLVRSDDRTLPQEIRILLGDGTEIHHP